MMIRLLFIAKYFLAWVLCFEFFRIIFILANYGRFQKEDVLLSLWHGLRMDLSMSAYITVPVILFQLAGLILSALNRQVIIRIYTSIIFFLIFLCIVVDIGMFKAWGFRLDATPLRYISNPKEIWASIAHLPVFWILAGMILVNVLVIWFIIGKIKIPTGKQKENKWLSALALLLIAAAMVIPMRGGFQLAPLNQSGVYFSKNNFANQASLNAPWNFIHSVTHKDNDRTNPFLFTGEKESKLFRDSLFVKNNSFPQLIDTANCNIVLVIWESFTAKVIDKTSKGIEITPRFNQLRKEGIFFPEMYASGDRTDKGIVSILSGFHAQPTTSIVKSPAKASKLPMLPDAFRKKGWFTSFYYGGEPEFANMKAYLMRAGFETFITVDDFPSSQRNSKWGAHDGVVMEKLITDMASMKPPFFTTWLTLSSHEPFETPVKKVIKENDDESRFFNSLHYTDSIIGLLIDRCRKQSWWNNTLMIIIPDHGNRLPRTESKIDEHKISMLMLGGAVKNAPVVVSAIGNQTDLSATLLNQFHQDTKNFTWSRNLFDSTSLKWTYFAFNNGFGYIQPGAGFVFDNTGKQVIERHGIISDSLIRRGRLIQQLTFQDYLDQ